MNILDQEVILELFRQNYLLFIAALYFGSCVLTYYIIPKVLWVSKEKNLTVQVNSRSSHKSEIPSFGGVAFYMVFILILALVQSMRLSFVGNHLIAAMTILFMVGLKDDLVVSTARVKFFGQIAATCFIVFSPELKLESLYGFFGIYHIPESVGYVLSALIVIALINAYNLIDGIDGLAAMIGIVVSGVYAWVFYGTAHPFYVLVSISVAGVLSAYLRYNFSRGHRKLFMGDSGSLVIGLILAFLTLKHLSMQPYLPLERAGYSPGNRPLFLLCVLFIPVFDTLRVMIIRVFRGESPFSADRNHAHHVLLDLGFSHLKASIFLAVLNLAVIGTFFYVSNKFTNLWLSFIVVLIYGCGFLLFARLKFITSNKARRIHAENPIETAKG